MIRSMTAFGAARAESPEGTLAVELRSVNSRFLDLNFRIPDDLRSLEGMLREQLGKELARGKVDVRVNYSMAADEAGQALDPARLAKLAGQLEAARQFIPDTAPPGLADLLKAASAGSAQFDLEAWARLGARAALQAIADFQANREREGARLAQEMLASAAEIARIVAEVEAHLPALLAEHQKKLAAKLHDALEAACPGGLAQISGAELSARIAQEASLFSLRIDVAEELARLRSHIDELRHLLEAGPGAQRQARPPFGKSKPDGIGKRLDFLFQEMNREANTLGSKAGGLAVTRAAIDLKLLIEQLREQAQNIE